MRERVRVAWVKSIEGRHEKFLIRCWWWFQSCLSWHNYQRCQLWGSGPPVLLLSIQIYRLLHCHLFWSSCFPQRMLWAKSLNFNGTDFKPALRWHSYACSRSVSFAVVLSGSQLEQKLHQGKNHIAWDEQQSSHSTNGTPLMLSHKSPVPHRMPHHGNSVWAGGTMSCQWVSRGMLISQPDPGGSGCVLSRGTQTWFSFYLAVVRGSTYVFETLSLLIFTPVEQFSRYWRENGERMAGLTNYAVPKCNYLWKSRF